MGLDKEDLKIMEDYLDLNPAEEIISLDDEYETDEEYKDYERWKCEELGIPYHKACYVLASFTLTNDEGKSVVMRVMNHEKEDLDSPMMEGMETDTLHNGSTLTLKSRIYNSEINKSADRETTWMFLLFLF